MKVVFLSNYFNHHQSPFSDEMFKLIGDNYCFVETTEIPKFRRELGYEKIKRPYVIRYDENKECVREKIFNAHILLVGFAPEFLLNDRKKNNKIIIRYSERLFKKKPSLVRFFYHLIRLNLKNPFWKPIYMLCASAYTASDYQKLFLFKHKCYKWGYFPKLQKFNDIDKIIAEKKTNSILWVGRLIDWKHPEIAIELAYKLKSENIVFSMDIIGIGEMYEKIQNMVVEKELSDCVHLLGAKSPECVRYYMEKSEIFISTSDRNEGWGAVINEAMGSACALVSSIMVGAAPFLIQHGENGFIYNRFDDLVLYVKKCLVESAMRKEISQKAYKTIEECWCPQIAAARFLSFCDDLIKYKRCDQFFNGPCSLA